MALAPCAVSRVHSERFLVVPAQFVLFRIPMAQSAKIEPRGTFKSTVKKMTQEEAIALQSKALTRLREIQLCRLRKENLVLRAQIALMTFYEIYNARPEIVPTKGKL
jgi:hypothetical protein